jgi:hypothetical protein
MIVSLVKLQGNVVPHRPRDHGLVADFRFWMSKNEFGQELKPPPTDVGDHFRLHPSGSLRNQSRRRIQAG